MEQRPPEGRQQLSLLSSTSTTPPITHRAMKLPTELIQSIGLSWTYTRHRRDARQAGEVRQNIVGDDLQGPPHSRDTR